MRYCFVIVAILLVLIVSGCKDNNYKDIVDGIGDLAVSAGKATYSNPAVLAAYAERGWDGVREVGLPIFWSNLKLQALPLAEGTKTERKLFDMIQDRSPMVAAMLYRDTEQGPAGLWIDLNTAAQSVGYDGASIGLLLVLTPEQWDWLGANIGQLAVQHYLAVRGETEPTEPSGIELGGD